MRIAQFCPYDMDRVGGVQQHVRDLSQALQHLGHEVTILAPRLGGGFGNGRPTTGQGATGIVHIGRGWRMHLDKQVFEVGIALGAERRKLIEMVSNRRFDVIHYHTIYTPVLAAQLLKHSRSANVATFHDVPQDTRSGAVSRRYLRYASRRFLPRLDGAISTSEVSTRHLDLSKAGRMHIVPPCVDLERFMVKDKAVNEFKDDRINILFLGRLQVRKGAIFLLRAYERLCAAGIRARLFMVGDGAERVRLERFAIRHALPEVAFHGFVPDTRQWYAACDIFCAPSLYGEGFGIVIAEAMASGKPVVAGANPGYKNLLVDEAGRFLTPPGDVEALYQSLRALAEDRDLRRRLGEWGRREALKYDCRTVAPHIVSIYEDAVRSRGALGLAASNRS